jgi:predicted CopG family antitoxin
MQQGTTTVRVSRRTHQILTDLAQRRGRSVSDVVEKLAENARRQDILQQYNARMAELLEHPEEKAAWQHETTESELSAADVDDHAQAIAR